MNRNTALILTLVTVVLFGCPGLFACLGGAIATTVSFIPGAEIDIAGSTDPAAAQALGVGGMCLGLFFIAIPVLVWFFALRRRRGASEEPAW